MRRNRNLVIFISLFLAAAFAIACGGKVELTEAEKESGKRAGKQASDSAAVSSGTLSGQSGHTMSGTVFLKRSEKGYLVEFGEDFKFDGAPAPVVAFGKQGYRKETGIGTLRQNDGRHAYEVPEKIDAAEYDEIWVWCTDYDVPLGTAKLSAE